MARRLPKQLPLPVRARPTWGGARDGAGRKPKGPRAGAPHDTRPFHDRHRPVHVTLRAHRDLRSLREWRISAAIGVALKAAAALPAARTRRFRVVHFSIQPDHVHLLVEAADRAALSRGVQGLAVRLARGVNRQLGRRGQVFGDRFHARPLARPAEVRHALVYVLQNWKKHVEDARGIDECSSAAWFDGWRGLPGPPRTDRAPVSPPATWLLARGWRLGRGAIALDEAPRSPPARQAAAEQP